LKLKKGTTKEILIQKIIDHIYQLQSIDEFIKEGSTTVTEPKSNTEGVELYCFCRTPHNDRFMICCDKCDEWFHGECVGIKEEETGPSTTFYCPKCRGDPIPVPIIAKPKGITESEQMKVDSNPTIINGTINKSEIDTTAQKKNKRDEPSSPRRDNSEAKKAKKTNGEIITPKQPIINKRKFTVTLERTKSVAQDLNIAASNIQELIDTVINDAGIPSDAEITLYNPESNNFTAYTNFDFKILPDKIKILAAKNEDLKEIKPMIIEPVVIEEKKTISIHEQLPTETPEQLHDILDKLRALNQKIIETHEENPPDEFICPISFELMNEPVIASDGYSYEKAAIQNWLITKGRYSPKTNLPLTSVLLYPNHIMATQIRKWRESCHS